MSLIKISHTPGDWVLGDWVEGEKIQTPFMGSWQAASGKVLETLPVGKRSREAYRVIVPIDINFIAADEESKTSGDFIIWEGKEYEVSVAIKWNNGMIPHWDIVCTRVPPKEEAA